MFVLNRRILLTLAIAVMAVSPALAQREKLPWQDLEIVEKQWPAAKKTVTGLRYVMLAEGTGEPARTGDLVSILYRGTLLDGTVFDEDQNRLRPFTFRLGRGLVIQGMDQGLKLLKEGSRVILIVPHELAYGTRGDPPRIKPRATLVFEIEMIRIQRLGAEADAAEAAAKK